MPTEPGSAKVLPGFLWDELKFTTHTMPAKVTRSKSGLRPLSMTIVKHMDASSRTTGYTVDVSHPPRPGSPLIGTGATEKEAIIAFFLRQSTQEFNTFKAHANEGVLINNKPWRDSKGSKR